MNDKDVMDMGRCDLCGKVLVNTTSTDFWASRTVYDETGEPIKTSGQVELANDYVTIGECCAEHASSLWAALNAQIGKIQATYNR